MIEYLLEDRKQLFTPTVFFLSGIFYTLISALVALSIFPNGASTAHILLSTLAVAPIIFRAVSIAADVLDKEPHMVFHVQSWLISLYFAYLLGAVIGFHLSFIVVPDKFRYALLSEQLEELSIIEGVKVKLSGMFTKMNIFWAILTNNLRVYVISLLLSFIYGTGGILLLNWNASIIAALIYTKTQSGAVLEATTSIFQIIPHSILEFLGYFMGGISGILLGVSIIQEGWNTKLLRDVLILLVSGFLAIFLGAVIEAGII